MDTEIEIFEHYKIYIRDKGTEAKFCKISFLTQSYAKIFNSNIMVMLLIFCKIQIFAESGLYSFISKSFRPNTYILNPHPESGKKRTIVIAVFRHVPNTGMGFRAHYSTKLHNFYNLLQNYHILNFA